MTQTLASRIDMAFNSSKERAIDNLFALLGIDEPTDKQRVIADTLVDNISRYIRSQVGF
jgi:hypothetical protein